MAHFCTCVMLCVGCFPVLLDRWEGVVTLMEEQLQDILKNQAVMAEQIKTLYKNQTEIKELTETVQRLAIAIEKQGLALQLTEKKVDGVRVDVDEIKSKPAKRWDALIIAIISAIVGFVLAKFGIK